MGEDGGSNPAAFSMKNSTLDVVIAIWISIND
jgi:hypothetical protein